ncbi:hypothetical protein COT75_00640 [Candidatus Beckwithbacteria bacterium CG10_big_fil_rev_8_21_14_0_10_34_10]|uniref:Uncharacterized protein n=1 Tax=Candidatus Beckwithbacteria bacterium CG10_big_fil_rev_8_21_14_0_10_34_10 TaxID=1974495 RepID=A0A2H0WCQ6_9BACT|nr:MAG: hypothetical protein COT75_00640 [Candidatus Beckwithbacteria bacterium CG10_big_fil_rev_8_21_14_0_10_34_10]
MCKVLKKKGEAGLLFLLFVLFYIFFQLKSIYGGDSGDFVTAAWLWGSPHAPGYPLYTLLSGILVHLIPINTPAWRVGLISSISSALTLSFFYLLLKKFTKNKLSSLIATLTLAFIYPFWLYSEVAEVFALNNLFVILLTYLFFSKSFSLFFLVLGLSFSHHHTVVLLLPAFFILWWQKKHKKEFKFRKKDFLKFGLFFLLGSLFYLYPPLACQKSPLVCWDDPTNIKNFIRLITRADYGIFKSNSQLGNAPILRVYSFLSGLKMIYKDFTFPGILLILSGLYAAFKKYKELFRFLIITLFLSLFFIFYASFVLVNDFMVGTFERFLIFPYLFLAFCFGFGVEDVFEASQTLAKKFSLSKPSKEVLTIGIKIILFIIPLSFLISNFKKISILKNDLSAEKMVEDLLRPLPENSIILVSSDTTVFNSNYVRYVLNYRQDVIVVDYPHLPLNYYQKLLNKHFPDLVLPETLDYKIALEEFIKGNEANYLVFSDAHIFEPEKNWLPYGLAWQYLPKEKQPEKKEIIKMNTKIWAGFNDPLSGSLGKYKNLFLADILRVYQDRELDFASYLLLNDYLNEAQEIFTKNEEKDPNNQDVLIGLGAIHLKKMECNEAKAYFTKVVELNDKNATALGYLRKTALDCFGDEEEAKKFENKCLDLKKQDDYELSDLKDFEEQNFK